MGVSDDNAAFDEIVAAAISMRYLIRNVFWRIELMMDKYSIKPRR